MASKRRERSLRVYDVSSKTGVRRELDLDRLVIGLRPGVEVEIDLSPHPRFAGQVNLLCPPFDKMKSRYEGGDVDSFAVFFGGENVLHVMVETRKRRRASKATPARASRPRSGR